MSLGRRGFLGRLFGLAAVAAVEPSTLLEQRFAAVEVPPFEVADLATLAASLKRTYSSGETAPVRRVRYYARWRYHATVNQFRWSAPGRLLRRIRRFFS